MLKCYEVCMIANNSLTIKKIVAQSPIEFSEKEKIVYVHEVEKPKIDFSKLQYDLSALGYSELEILLIMELLKQDYPKEDNKIEEKNTFERFGYDI